MKTRLVKDSMGQVAVPEDAYYAAQTQRAVENFPISGQPFPREFIRSLGLIKLAMADANTAAGNLEAAVGDAIRRAAREVVDGRWDAQFVVDVYQTGSGTSTNMNANEVIATRATEILTGSRTGEPRVHPNDHVNMGQSSNDVIPSAIHLAAAVCLQQDLLPSLGRLQGSLAAKAEAFMPLTKIGRTHLQDATPITLGQEFSGYATQVAKSISRVESTLPDLYELALGGTAVGTGLNADASAVRAAIAHIAGETNLPFREAGNHFEAQAAKDAVVQASATLKTVAVSLLKIANDIRWLGSGPRCGIGEIILPATQPGSSIMPGKVNPVQAEALTMVCARVIGNDATITLAGQSAVFELNVMMPVMATGLLESIKLLANGAEAFRSKCVDGIEADRERLTFFIEKSLALVTALVPELGYDRAAALAKRAYAEGRTIRELLTAEGALPADKLDELLDARKMTGL